jgi:hypothetical protein
MENKERAQTKAAVAVMKVERKTTIMFEIGVGVAV